jgi:hypothetical protein
MFAQIRRWLTRPRSAEIVRNEHGLTVGDRVCIRENDNAIAHASSGRCGVVYGETTPSVSDVEVIGTTAYDYAVNVCLDGDVSSAWYAVELLEFIERGAGTTINVAGQTYTLRADGGWEGPT